MPPDPLPPSFKQLFYKDRPQPNLSADYDIVAFDADHCLVKYNMPEFQKLLLRVYLLDLHLNAGYPEQMSQFDFESDFMQSGLNYGVWDIKRGYVLKLGENNEVLAAMKGRRKVPLEEIKEVYGSPTPVFPLLQFPAIRKFDCANGDNFWTLPTLFDSAMVTVILVGVDFIDTGKVHKSYQDLCTDIRGTFAR